MTTLYVKADCNPSKVQKNLLRKIDRNLSGVWADSSIDTVFNG